MITRRMFWPVSAAWGALAWPAFAADVPAAAGSGRYGVLSLVGDELVLVNRRMQTGSRTNPNDRSSLPIAATTLDDAAVDAAGAAIRGADPAADAVRVSIRDPRVFALQDRLVVPDDAAATALRDAVRALVADAGVQRLLIVTKRRADARFDLAEGTIGDGKVGGVGFYLDQQFETNRTDTGERATGFLATFASITASLVEVAPWRLVDAQPGYASRLTTAAGNHEAATAWQAMTPQRKVELLDAMVREATAQAVGRVVTRSSLR